MAGISVAVAILVGLFSSFIQSLGLTIQRKSHILDSSLPLPQRKRPIRRPLWLLGFGIYITSNIFSTIFQLDALPIVILAPLGAISLIYNAVLARLMLGDKFGKIWVMGTGLIALGAVLIAIFGVVQEEHHTLDEILVLFRRSAFVVFFSIVSVVTAAVIVISHFTAFHVHRQSLRIRLPDGPSNSGSGRSTPTSIVPSNYASPHPSSPSIPFRHTKPRRWSTPSPSSSSVPLPKLPSQVQKHQSQPPHHLHLEIDPPVPAFPKQLQQINEGQQKLLTWCGLGFASASGTLSGMCLVLAKAAVELLVLTINYFRTNGAEGKNELLRIQTWFLVLGLAVCAVLQLVYLNYSLTFASPAIICPLAFCFFNLSSIFDGLVFYDQFSKLSTLQITIVSLGVAILLLGVWVVSAIQPDSGVDIGTWVEEESETDGELIDDQESIFPHQNHNHTQDQAVEPLSPTMGNLPQHGTGGSTTEGLGLHRSVFASPEMDSPASPASPMSPMSPTTRRRHHRMRYGSLVPDLPTGAPTGFSIGLGASSPGFALRTGSFSIDGNFHPHHNITHPHPHPHSPLIGHHAEGSGSGGVRDLWGNRVRDRDRDRDRGRSRSEGQRGIQDILQGQDPGTYEARTDDYLEHEVEENTVEGELRNWNEVQESGKRKAWWERLFGRPTNGEQQGKIRLTDEQG